MLRLCHSASLANDAIWQLRLELSNGSAVLDFSLLLLQAVLKDAAVCGSFNHHENLFFFLPTVDSAEMNLMLGDEKRRLFYLRRSRQVIKTTVQVVVLVRLFVKMGLLSSFDPLIIIRAAEKKYC